MKERFEATADTKKRYLDKNMLTTTNLLTVWRVDSHNFVILMLLFLAQYFDILPTDVNGQKLGRVSWPPQGPPSTRLVGVPNSYSQTHTWLLTPQSKKDAGLFATEILQPIQIQRAKIEEEKSIIILLWMWMSICILSHMTRDNKKILHQFVTR